MQTVKHSVSLRRFVWFAGIGLTLMSLGFGFKTVAALGAEGPDPVDMGMAPADVAAYVIADQRNSIKVRSVTIPLYFDNAAVDRMLTVTGLDLCSDARDTAPNNGNNYRDTGDVDPGAGAVSSGLAGKNITSLSVPGRSTIFGKPSTANGCYQATKTVTILGSQLALDTSTGKYKMTITASIPADVTDIQNHFSIRLSEGKVGYSSDAAADNFAIAQDYPRNVYRRYALPFAPSCSVTSSETKSISLYDDDNGTTGIQPIKFVVYVEEISPTGSVTTIPLSITAVSKSNQGGNKWYLTSGNQQTARITATYKPFHKYRFVVENVYSVNLLQFQLPYDSINYDIACPKAKATCDYSGIPTNMLVGQQANFVTRVKLSASYEPPMDATNPTMSVVVTNPLGVQRNYGNVPYSHSGLGARTVLSSSPALTYTPQQGGRHTVRWTVAGSTLEGDVTCTREFDAGYRPYFSVTGGDIYSGGGIRSWNTDSGNYFGAGTTLAAIATGDIQNFVSGFGLPGGAATRNGSGLAFANSTATGTTYGGGYNVTAFRPTVDASTQWTATTLNLGDAALQDGKTYTHSGNLTISGTLPTNKRITVVLRSGSAIIAGNIAYGSYTDPETIPRFTLLVQNGNIYVGSAVTELHGAYYAGGSGGAFYSCATGASPVTMTTSTAYVTCGKKLTVYGAVAATKLMLTRTYGSLIAVGATPAEPAEEFYYSPELWLSTGTRERTSGGVRYDSYVSLPPIL